MECVVVVLETEHAREGGHRHTRVELLGLNYACQLYRESTLLVVGIPIL